MTRKDYEMMPPGEPIRRRLEKQRLREEKRKKAQERRERRRQELLEHTERKRKEAEAKEQRLGNHRLLPATLRTRANTATQGFSKLTRGVLSKAQSLKSGSVKSGVQLTAPPPSQPKFDDGKVDLELALFENFLSLLDQSEATTEVGVFRVPGRLVWIQYLYSKILSGANLDLEDPIKCYTHDLGSALKLYLSSLHEPLCTYSLYNDFIQTYNNFEQKEHTKETKEEFLEQLISLVQQLPELHRTVLTLLLAYLIRIIANEKINKMTVQNCGVVFGPVIFQPKEMSADYIFAVRTHCLIVESFIRNYKRIFGVDPPVELSKASTEEDEDECSVMEVDEDVSDDDPTEDEPSNQTTSTSMSGSLDDLADKRGSWEMGSVQRSVKSFEDDKHVLIQLKKGDKAPYFTGIAHTGEMYSLYENSLNQGKKVVIFFYPSGFSPSDFKAIKSSYALFFYANCDIIGISSDSHEAQARFAGEYALPYTLICDEDEHLKRMFGVPTSDNKVLYIPFRYTFVISTSGEIAHLDVSPISHRKQNHVLECLMAVSEALIDEHAQSGHKLRQATRYKKRGGIVFAPT